MAAETNGEIVWKRNDSASDQEEVWDDSALIEAYDRAVNQVKEEIAQRSAGTGSSKKKGRNRKQKVNHTPSWKVGDYCQAVFSEDGLHYEAYIKEVNQAKTSCLVQYIGYGNEEIVPVSDLSPSLGKEARAQQEANAGQPSQAALKKDATSETSSQQSFSQSKSRAKQQQNQWRYSAQSSPGRQVHSQPGTSSAPPGPPGGLLSWLKTIVSPQAQTEGKSHSCNQGCPYSGYACQMNQSVFHQVQHHIPPPPFPLDQSLVDNEEALAAMLMSWYMSGYHTGYYQAMQQSRSLKPVSTPCCMHSTK